MPGLTLTPVAFLCNVTFLAAVLLLVEKACMLGLPGSLLLHFTFTSSFSPDSNTTVTHTTQAAFPADATAGKESQSIVASGQWKGVLLLEPLCPRRIDEAREGECLAQGVSALGNRSCPNFGLANNWANHPSDSVMLPSVSDGCYATKTHYKAAYTAMFRRALPTIRALGWRNFEVANFGSRHSYESVRNADFVLCTTKHYSILSNAFPCKKYAVIAPDDTATLEKGVDFNNPNIVLVLQHTVLNSAVHNNQLPIIPSPKLFKGTGDPQSPRHLQWLAQPGQVKMAPRCPPLSLDTLTKVVPLIPQALRLKYPLDCGGKAGNLAMQGAWTGGPSWSPPLAQRGIDVMYVGAPHAASGSLLRNHRRRVTVVLSEMQRKHPELRIVSGGPRMSSTEYVEALRNTKLFVSPFGFGEFSGKDYESALAGCLLVKPMAHKLISYPNIYAADVALDVAPDFSNLEEVVLGALADTTASQVKVDAQRQQLLSHDIEKLGRDFDRLLRERLGGRSPGAVADDCQAGASEDPNLRKCSQREGRHAYRFFNRERTQQFASCGGIIPAAVVSEVMRKHGGLR